MSITIGTGVQSTGYTTSTKKAETARTTAAAETKNASQTTATTTTENPNVVQTNATGDTLEISKRTAEATTDTATNKTEKKQVDEKDLARLLQESERDAKQFMSFMNKVLGNQGKQDTIAKLSGQKDDTKTATDDLADILGMGKDVDLDDMQAAVGDLKKGLENGTLKVSQEDIDKAKELTSEDGYYGVKQTSARIVDFAKAISGGDTSKAEMLREAAKKGFESAAELWGGMDKAPQITKDTYAAVMKGFDDWVGGKTA